MKVYRKLTKRNGFKGGEEYIAGGALVSEFEQKI